MKNLVKKLQQSKQKHIKLRKDATKILVSLYESLPKFFIVSPKNTDIATSASILYQYIDEKGHQWYILDYIKTNNTAKNEEIRLLGNTLLKEIADLLNTLNSIDETIEERQRTIQKIIAICDE